MMGPKKLSDIERELRQVLGNDREFAAWLDRQCSRPASKPSGVPVVEKDLLWLRELLREAVAEKKPHARGAKKQKAKRASAVR